MKKVLKEKLKKKLQKIFWIYPCSIFVINGTNEFKIVEPKIKCGFIPITLDNCHRVRDFREEARISEYRDKLARNEIGYFADMRKHGSLNHISIADSNSTESTSSGKIVRQSIFIIVYIQLIFTVWHKVSLLS